MARKPAPKSTRKPKRKAGRHQLEVQQNILDIIALAKKYGIKEIDVNTVRTEAPKLEKLAAEIDGNRVLTPGFLFRS